MRHILGVQYLLIYKVLRKILILQSIEDDFILSDEKIESVQEFRFVLSAKIREQVFFVY